MKKLKFFVILLVMVLVTPLFFGCGETTLDSVPWGATEESPEEIVEKFNESKTYLNDVGLPVKFSTVTTFNLSKRLDGSGEEKTVRDETILTLYYVGDMQNLAEMHTKRYVDNRLASDILKLYDYNDSKMYTTTKKYLVDGSFQVEPSETYSVGKYSQSNTGFLEILSQIIKLPEKESLTGVSKKTFNETDYYKLVSSSTTATGGGLDLLNEQFEENANLFSEPNVYQVYDKTHDYVLDFSSEYSIGKSGYLSYFSYKYSVFDSNNSVSGERGVYLKVSSTTNLEKFGSEVTKPNEVTDKDFYAVSTFVDVAKKEGSYVCYVDPFSGDYETYKVYKVNGGMFVYATPSKNSTGTEEKWFYFKTDGNAIYGYELNVDAKTYKITSDRPSFLYFDYTKGYFSKGTDGYIYGTNDNYTAINIANASDDKMLFVVKTQSSNWLYVSSYGDDSDDLQYKFEDFKLEESV